MMNTRYVNLLLLVVVLLGIVASCGNGSKEERIDELMDRSEEAKTTNHYDNAFDYHQAMVGLQTEIAIQMLDLQSMEQLEVVRNTIVTNLSALESLSFSGMDYGLKSSIVDLFSFYLKIVENEFPEMFDLINEMEANPMDEEFVMMAYTRLIEIQTSIEEEEQELSRAMDLSEAEFTRMHNLQLTENPLQEDIDAVIENDVYSDY